MDANTMQFAMEQMKKMSPEQLQAMMQNMPPDMVNQAMSQMKNMKPEDWEQAKQQLSSMDSDTLARQAAQAQAQMAGRTQYVLNASNQLKQEGNQLHNRGAYKEAVEKYERAKSNVESFTNKEARDLIRACTLNLSSCYLNLKQYDKCLEQCNQVLAGEPDNLKALYRRGQAHMGTSAWPEAAADLERAMRLAAGSDPSQVQPIKEKLQEAKDQVSALRAAGKLPAASAVRPSASDVAPAPAAPKSSSPASKSEGTLGSAGSASAAGSSGATAFASGGAGSGFSPDPDMMAKATEMMRANPDALKQAQEMMRGMSDEQLRAMGRQMGVDVAPEVLRGGLGGLDPELMAKVAKVQADLPPDLRGPDAVRNPESMKRLAELMAQKPEMASAMGQLLSSVDPKQLEEMARAAGLPAGVTITPEMAKAAAESLPRMSPQELQAAMQVASNMPPPATLASAASVSSATAASNSERSQEATGPSSVSAMPVPAGMPPVDPKVAADMLAAMSPEQLASISKMMPGGEKLQLTPEMAKMAAEMMKNMTPEDIARMQNMAAAMSGGTGVAPSAAVAGGDSTASPSTAEPGLPGMGGAGGASMAQMAADMMKNMTAEDIARMQDMASRMGVGGAASGTGLGAGVGPDAMKMMSDPKMIESAVRMMRGMDPEAMVSMMMSSGMCRDRGQAEAMARQMSNLTDTQLSMMINTAGALQSARATGEQVLAWMRRNVLLVVALIVLLLAWLLRWLGWM